MNANVYEFAATVAKVNEQLKALKVVAIKQNEVEFEPDRFRELFPDVEWTQSGNYMFAHYWLGDIYFHSYEVIKITNNADEELPFEDKVEQAERKYDERYDELLGVLND